MGTCGHVRFAAVLVLVTVAGCSTFIDAPRGPRAVECTTSRAAPLVDTAAAGVALLGGTALWIASEHTNHDAQAGAIEAVSGGSLLAIGVLAAASALYGYVTVDRCRRSSM